ncbi:MAG: hypothetical protein GY705_24290 [Bacteroidetes bacterium]|nr:hypothetical protein [Bacteroidota bacterium]
MLNFILLQAKTPHLWDLLFGDPGRISRKAFEAILVEVYIAGAIIAVLFLLLAILVSNAISYDTQSPPRDPRKRRIAFWVFGIITIILLFFIGTFSVTEMSKLQAEQFQKTTYIAIGINALIYFVGGFILSKLFPRSKIGTWFPSRDK